MVRRIWKWYNQLNGGEGPMRNVVFSTFLEHVIAHLFCFQEFGDVFFILEAEQVGFFVVCSGNHMKRADANNDKN